MEIINQYIEKKYSNWLDYSRYHCTQANIQDEAQDILNEVIVYLLQKDESKLKKMVTTPSKCGRYMEIDIYVLRMIKLNIFSPTSPYQNKYKPIPADTNIELSRLNIEDLQEEEIDIPSVILDKMNQIRLIVNELNLSEKARSIFEFRFFHQQPFSQYKGIESKMELYETYNKVLLMIKDKLKGNSLF